MMRPLLLDFVRARLRPERVVLVGISIGSGVAAGLAARRAVDGLILVTPFDSLEAVAHERFPWLPVPLLIRHKLPSADFLRNSRVPVAIVAAQHDGVVPPARTAALAAAVGNLYTTSPFQARSTTTSPSSGFPSRNAAIARRSARLKSGFRTCSSRTEVIHHTHALYGQRGASTKRAKPWRHP
jgi:pimeloyl-ACP methyl ester carboxylesterase